ncbi:3-deoxy-D-manno-octulosonic acid transferase [Planktotalea sp.]|uniref:3-deoxy-D-manno-octulosonic acid transferase n=1 Tax=Planktotalea sp. TaxID=2029877 RepID=UPI003C78E859
MGSLSLTTYKALNRSAKAAHQDPYKERPSGPLIWAVVHDDANARAVLYLLDRMRMLRGPCNLLLTYIEKPPYVPRRKGVLSCVLPIDTTEASRAFLEHWQPSYCLWFGGELRPVLVEQAHERAVPMSLLSASDTLLDQPIWRWLPSLARETLNAFNKISAKDAGGQRILRKMDGARRAVSIDGLLQETVLPPSVNESVFDEVSRDLNGRPVWLAADVQEDELATVLQAHRESIRIAHRLILILVAATFPISVEARTVLKSQGWRVCYWEDGDPIEEETQIIFVEEPEEMGLWFRASPFCFLGSTLSAGHGGNDPYVPASLGSAIIYGPNVGRFTSSFSRLAAAGAARIIKDTEGLSRAIVQLLAADQAASMAHAAWVTISEGAEVTDAVIDDIQEHWDALESNG